MEPSCTPPPYDIYSVLSKDSNTQKGIKHIVKEEECFPLLPRRNVFDEWGLQLQGGWSEGEGWMGGSGGTIKLRCVGQEEQWNSDIWVRRNNETQMCGSGGTMKFRCVGQEEQWKSDIWVRRNNETQLCGSGGTMKLRCVGQEEQLNLDLWLMRKKQTQICGSWGTSIIKFVGEEGKNQFRCVGQE